MGIGKQSGADSLLSSWLHTHRLPFWLCGTILRSNQKNHARSTLCAKPGHDVIYFCPFVSVVGIIFSTFHVEVECQKNNYLFWNSTFAGKKWHVYKSIILMEIQDRPLSVNLCNNNKIWDYFSIFGKRKGQKDHTNIIITCQLVLQINGTKYVSRLKMTICKYIFARLWEAAVDTSFSSLCTVPCLFLVNNRRDNNGWTSRRKGSSSINWKEEATSSTKRGERSVHCCFS